MQATVYDMIQWLKTLPSDALVECLSHSNGTGYYDQGGWCTTEPFDIQAGSCYYEGKPLAHKFWELSKDSRTGVTTLLIGEKA